MGERQSESAVHMPTDSQVRPSVDVRREKIVRAAATVLAESGFEAARLRDVAKLSGSSIGLIQHHFETRDQLFRTAFSWSIDNLIGRWQCAAVSESNPWQQLQLLTDELTTDPELTRRCVTWIEFCASASRHDELKDGVSRAYLAWRELMTGIVLTGIDRGVFAPQLDAHTAVELLCTLVDGCDLAIATQAAGFHDTEFDAIRYRHLFLSAARLTLGVTTDSTATPGAQTRSEGPR